MSPSRSVPRGQEGRGEDGGQDNGQTGLGPLLLPRPQVSPTLTAEELTNQVLEIRGTAAGTDLWVTFEIREHGELGECDRAPETDTCEGRARPWVPPSRRCSVLSPASFPPRRRLLCPGSEGWGDPGLDPHLLLSLSTPLLG